MEKQTLQIAGCWQSVQKNNYPQAFPIGLGNTPCKGSFLKAELKIKKPDNISAPARLCSLSKT